MEEMFAACTIGLLLKGSQFKLDADVPAIGLWKIKS